ncbi:MAG: N-acetylglucosamine kinase [Streptosporangiaceae bacterium]
MSGQAPRPAGPAGPDLPAVLAVDGGNSKTDLVLVAADGRVLAQVRGPGVPLRLSAETLALLSTLARAAARQAGLGALHGPGADTGPAAPGPGLIARHLVACMANVDLPEEERELDEMLRAQGWSQTVDVANDTLAVLRAGLDGRLPAGLPGGPPAGTAATDLAAADLAAAGQDVAGRPGAGRPGDPQHAVHWGVGITCGAGINGVCVAPDGRTSRYLALGQLTGDWGGGQGLACAAMWSAARAEDGRGPQTLLREAVLEHFGVGRITDVAVGIHLGKIPEHSLHGLVPVLLQVAGQGDPVAGDLVSRLADEITGMAVAAISRLGLDGLPVPVVLGGGVLTARDPLLTRRIRAGLAARMPAASMRIVGIPPIAGAALLGLDDAGAGPAAQARLRSAYAHSGGTGPAQPDAAGPGAAAGPASPAPELPAPELPAPPLPAPPLPADQPELSADRKAAGT